MELWNDIANAPYPHWWIPTVIIGVALLAATGTISVTYDRRGDRAKDTDADADVSIRLYGRSESFGYITVALLFATIVAVAITAATSRGKHHDHLEDLVANYLHDEYDLVPLTPVQYFSGDVGMFDDPDDVMPRGVHATVVREDGTKADVHVAWDDVNTRPHNPDWELPEGFDPITVTITPHDQPTSDAGDAKAKAGK